MKNITEFITESEKEHFVVLVKTHYSEGGYFIDKDDYEFKLIHSNSNWSNSGTKEHADLKKKIDKLSNDYDKWMVYGDPVDTRANIKKEMNNPETIKWWNDKQAKIALEYN